MIEHPDVVAHREYIERRHAHYAKRSRETGIGMDELMSRDGQAMAKLPAWWDTCRKCANDPEFQKQFPKISELLEPFKSK